MRWSWKIAQIAGIDIRIHATFLLLVAWIALSYYWSGGTLAAALSGVLFLLALFVCVVLHELGHALAARRFGVRTHDITLLPIGGVARLERIPTQPQQELWVALAGPAVNAIIALALAALLLVSGGLSFPLRLSLTDGPFLQRLMLVNLWLGLFNMIPAFPMDGGRVVRALLATRLDYVQATHIAATLGQGIALLFGLLGLLSNPFLLFIAFFVYIGASQEASLVQVRSALGGIPVRRAMITDFKTLEADEPLSRAVGLLMSGTQQDFPVLERGHLAGILSRTALVEALQRLGEAAPVRQAMLCEMVVLEPEAMLEEAAQRLQSQQCHTAPVLQNGQLVGLLTMENIGEFIMIQSALRRAAQAARFGAGWAA